MEEDWYVLSDVLKSREMDSREGERENERVTVCAYGVSIDARW